MIFMAFVAIYELVLCVKYALPANKDWMCLCNVSEVCKDMSVRNNEAEKRRTSMTIVLQTLKC